jgi:cobalamin biosynthesis Co2+ chelatase CbiK
LKLRQQKSQRMKSTKKNTIVAQSKSANQSFDSSLVIRAPAASVMIAKKIKVTITKPSQASNKLRGPVHDFFQMLLGSSFIDFLFEGAEVTRL